MGKRKREDDDDYVDFCSGLQRNSSDGKGDNSYIYSISRPFKRPRINPNFYAQPTVHYTYINPNESIYREIQSLITNKHFVVDEIIKVNNPVLEDAYYSKKRLKRAEYGGTVEEALLFHGTRESNLGSICTFNFDWRLTGKNKGHKFGKGVNFSTNAKYASSYSDPNTYNKVMIVAKVLIGKVCRGHHDMTIPPRGFDTSAKGKDGIVLVKYEDNEFYPAYILRYHFRSGQKSRDRRRERQRHRQDSHNKYHNDLEYYDNRNSGHDFGNNFNAQRAYEHFYHGLDTNNNHNQDLNNIDRNLIYLSQCLDGLNEYLRSSNNQSGSSSDYSYDGNYHSYPNYYSFY